MTDQWREIPSSNAYPGLTSLTRGDRTVTAAAYGEDARAAVLAKMGEIPVDYDDMP